MLSMTVTMHGRGLEAGRTQRCRMVHEWTNGWLFTVGRAQIGPALTSTSLMHINSGTSDRLGQLHSCL